MPDPYLVLFVADAATDGHADALRAVARRVPNAGFFDGVGGDELGAERTVGTYLRTETLAGGRELLAEVAAISAALGVRFEVQHVEAVLGHLVDGHPDAELARHLGDIPKAV